MSVSSTCCRQIFFILYFITMSDNLVRHLVAIIATIICLLAYYSGYVSGMFGWWWSVFTMLIFYALVYKIIDK